jgi:ribosome-associated toxin RatA of RatAB toxin-antitoxin module
MREIQLDFLVAGRAPAETYQVIRDFGRYPELCPAVRSVEILDAEANRTVSRWEVNFRKGVLRWVEEDTYDDESTRIDFRQTEGDIAVFDGRWICTDDPFGTVVVFEARLDMGIPTLADALEPIAVRALVDNIAAILEGLFPGAVLADPGGPPALSAVMGSEA